MSWKSSTLAIYLLFAAASSNLHAGPWTAIVEELATRTARGRVGSAERVFVIREAEEAPLILTKQATVSLDEGGLLRRFERLQGVDSAMRAEFKALSPAERRLAVELGEGAQRICRMYPGERGETILQYLDGTGLAQARTYGDFVVDGMAFIQSDEALNAIRRPFSDEAGQAISKTLRIGTVPEQITDQQAAELWKSAVRKTGDGAGSFWLHYVAPYKEKWIAGGLLLTYLAMPERFHDASGKLTEYGGREVGKLLGDSTLGLGRGLIDGLSDSVKRNFADAPFTTTATLVAVVGLLLFAIPVVRRLVMLSLSLLLPARLISSKSRRPKVESPLSVHTPLKE